MKEPGENTLRSLPKVMSNAAALHYNVGQDIADAL